MAVRAAEEAACASGPQRGSPFSATDAPIAALILIAPALIAPSRMPPPATATPPKSSKGTGLASGSGSAQARRFGVPLAAAAWHGLTQALRVGTTPLRAFMRTAALLWLQLVVRSIVHSRSFWQRGLGAAYSQPAALRDEMVARYRWPARVRGADFGVAAFTLGQIGTFLSEAWTRAVGSPAVAGAEEVRPADGEIARQLGQLGVPILLIHGVDDRIVPVWNSRRLAALVGPRATLVEVAGCGHCPQEEAAEVVAAAIRDFACTHGLLSPESAGEGQLPK